MLSITALGVMMEKILLGVNSKDFDVKQILHKNVLVIGDPNSGKTLLLEKIAYAYMEASIPVVLLDTTCYHKGKSLIYNLEASNSIQLFNEKNLDYEKIGDLLRSSKPIVAIDLSDSLEISLA